MFQQTMRDYYRLVTGIDREVGRIVARLSERGLADNTVIYLAADPAQATQLKHFESLLSAAR